MKFILISILLIFSASAFAQESEDDYMQYKIDKSQYEDRYLYEEIASDTLGFNRIEYNRDDKFGDLTSYAFSFVSYARRGADYGELKSVVDGISLRMANIPIVRRLGVDISTFAGVAHGEQSVGGMAGVSEFSMLSGRVPQSGRSVGLYFSGKGYLGGVRASLHDMLKRDWSMSAYVAARGGDDLYVKGVYQDAIDVGSRFTKYFPTGAILSVLGAVAISERGMRSGSTQEVFGLRADNLYNPLWGRQMGEVRNSRVRRDAVPFLVASYITQVSGRTSMTLSLGGDYGVRKMSSLGWYDAMTPRPDNYRYLPSYFADNELSDMVAEAWRAGDEDYTQINWADLYRVNSMSKDGAVYALDDRVERLARGEFALRLKSEFSSNVIISYGLRAWMYSSRNFKRMRDLLGADYLVDVDYYLMDDDSFSNSLQNDKRHPDRKISAGDRFSYDYSLLERGVELNAHMEYHLNRWRVDADVAVGSSTLLRRGYYEKELFQGRGSYGRSKAVDFTPYMLKIAAVYMPSAEHIFDFQAMMSARAPQLPNIFLNPQYNNRMADNLRMEQLAAVEANYHYKSTALDVTATLYLQSHRNRRNIFRAYDDLSGVYCDVDVEGIGTLCYGVEAAASYRISRNLRASAALAAGQYVYSKNPVVTHYSDTDNSIISGRSESLMGNCHVGGTPQLVGMIGLSYFNYRGWSASCGVQVAALRYVDASFVRRTERVLYQAAQSEEIFDNFAEQHRLNDAVTVDASVSRWFRLPKGRIVATLSVKNLLGNRNIVYTAYEPSRIRNYMSGERRVYLPQEDVLTYSYPRTFYAVVTWKF